MKTTRTEKDSMGEVEVPADALYGAQTQRAVMNFPVSQQRMPVRFLMALLEIKKAAAKANQDLGSLSEAEAQAIILACDRLLVDKDTLLQHFPVDVFQTGSGTSTNMNANEVIAGLANRMEDIVLRPNDHVNCSQSSNDVIPSSIHVSAALALQDHLLPSLQHLDDCIMSRATELADVCKTGRTHLMDAMPITFGQVLSGWSTQIRDNLVRIKAIQPELHQLALGGTAVGTGVNAPPEFAATTCRYLSEEQPIDFHPTPNPFAAMSSQDVAVALSGCLKTAAVSLMKISNDLRWMNSGPLAGLAEIRLPELQPGSSIMPGKVNPVIPESTAMVAAQIIGNDATITLAGQSGNFELNVMLPLVASRLLESIELLGSAARLLGDKAITGFTVNHATIESALHRNPILATALNPHIGYLKSAEIAKQAYAEGRPVLDVAEQLTDLSREQLSQILNPVALTNKLD
ncbi:class II fumarate hydratase [Granulosicoccus sp. 3-233]|uniref:class II fumarate hydratase n=1 Tax=Granulosicoccus sp. 3-233 TaxID=3417969 RepID=UPI003D326877